MPIFKNTCDLKVIKRLGGGAYGDVYATRTNREDIVAIKKLKTFHQRDILEVLALLFIVHPHIVHIKDIRNNDRCISKTDFGFTMDLLKDSISLEDRIQQGWIYDERTTTRLIYELCDTLAWLHAIGILHMDIKPDNIMIVNAQTRPSIKYIDFGGVKICFNLDEMELYPDSIVYTKHYIAPEFDNWNGSISDKYDVYALGTTIAEIVLGGLNTKPHLLNLASKIKNKHLLNLIQGMTEVDPTKRLTMNDVMKSPFFRGQRTSLKRGKLIEPTTLPTMNSASFWDYYKSTDSLSAYALVQMIDIFYLLLPYITIDKKHVAFHNEQMSTTTYMKNIQTLARHLTSDPKTPDGEKKVPYELLYIIKLLNGKVFRVTWNYTMKTNTQMLYCIRNYSSSFKLYTSNRIMYPEELPSITKGRHIDNTTLAREL